MDRLPAWSAVAVAVAASGCVGTVGPAARDDAPAAAHRPASESHDPAPNAAGPACSTALDPGPTFLRRLTNAEYRATVRDLLGDGPDRTAGFPVDPVNDGFDDNAEGIPLSDTHIEKYRDAAEQLAADAFADPARRARILPCDPTAARAACVNQFVATFGRRAFRRPLMPDESAALLAVAGVAASDPDPLAGARLALTAMLQAPQFLLRIEVGRPDPGRPGLQRLTGFEVATRLSYLLRGTTPDDTLLAAAEQGKLDTADGVVAQAIAMLQDDRTRQAMRSFFGQWLKTAQVGTVDRDGKRYPSWGSDLAASMREGTARLIDDFAWKDGARFLDVLQAPYTYTDARLARVYGAPAPATGWSRVDWDAGDGRAGLLTEAAVLTANSRTEAAIPIHRGAFVREKILCDELPPPPNVVPAIPDARPGQSDRDRLEQHRASPACSGCHSLMDPVGFGLAAFDLIGARRTTDSAGQPVSTSGSFSGFGPPEFDGAAALAASLRGSDKVGACVTKQVMRYALGRGDEPGDACLLAELGRGFGASGSFRALLLALVRSDSFRYRRAEGRL